MKNKFLSVLSISFLLATLFVTAVSAAVIWDINSFTGPTWLNPGYEFTFDVTEITGGTNDICIIYSVNSGSSQENHCTCTSPDCSANVGTWHCQVPTNEPDAAIVWNISGWTGGSCNGSPSLIQEGTFNTGPNAIELSSFEVSSEKDNNPTYFPILIISFIVLVFVVGVLWKYKAQVSQD